MFNEYFNILIAYNLRDQARSELELINDMYKIL
jgi:hypothetical protein